MANLNPTPGWDNIPQLEVVTPALAGAAGPMNTQAQALLNRTAQLKIDLDALTNNLDQVNNTADINKPVSTATQAALDLKAPLANPNFTGTVLGISKVMVGLGNVDNTSDLSKPVSAATQAALNLRAPLESPTFTGTVNGITKAMVGLGNVDNTPDASKPVSTPQQNVLNLKANKSGDTFTGPVTATQFNGSGAGLTGTASSLTAGGANAVNGVSGWSYSNLGNNPVYLWCTEGSATSQHLTTPGALSVNYANSAGSAGSLNGVITTAGGTFSGDIGASSYYSNSNVGIHVQNTGFNGSIYLQNLINANPGYSLNFQGIHQPGVFAGFRMFWAGNGTLIDFKDNGHIYSSNGWSSASDIRIKTNIEHIDPIFALDAIDAIRTITFEKTNESERVDGKQNIRYMGFAAQDWIDIAPEVVGVAGMSNPDMPDQLTMNYAATAPFMMAALKGLKAEVKALRAEIDALKAAALPVQ